MNLATKAKANSKALGFTNNQITQDFNKQGSLTNVMSIKQVNLPST